MELGFMRDSIYHAQRERLTFLGFAIIATATLLSVLINKHDKLVTPAGNFVLVGLAGIVLLAAEWLTIRSTVGIKSAAAYSRIFLEPDIPGAGYETRLALFRKKGWGITGSPQGIGMAYLALTAAMPLAWHSIVDRRSAVFTTLIWVIAGLSTVEAVALATQQPGLFWKRAEKRWAEVRTENPRE